MVTQYESGKSLPNSEMLLKLAELFKVNIDDLLRVDLSDNRIEQREKSTGNLVQVSNGMVQVTRSTRKNNVLVPIRAQAGYAAGWTQEYVEQELRYIDLPGVEGEARTFEIAGDSMEPLLSDGDYAVTRRVESAKEVREGLIYVVISSESGISAKYLYRMAEGMMLIPANRHSYRPTIERYDNIKEIWEVYMRLTRSLTNPVAFSDLLTDTKRLDRLEEELRRFLPGFGEKDRRRGTDEEE